LAVHEPERNHVAAHAADAADHHLWSDPRELMHRGQPADENKIADLAMAAQGSRGREDHVVADLAVVTDMGTIHEVTPVADAGEPTTLWAAAVHGHGLADGAAIPDLKPARVV